jgi:hypothetical protein
MVLTYIQVEFQLESCSGRVGKRDPLALALVGVYYYSLHFKLQGIPRILKSQNILSLTKIIEKITKNITSNRYTIKI